MSFLPPALAIALLTIYLLYHYIYRPVFTSALSKVPSAHPTASLLPAWIWYARRRGRETLTIFAAHQRLGPVVRLAPNEVSVASLDGLRKIYVGGFERTDWFLDFTNYSGTPNLVTIFDGKKHAARRRIVANVFSKSYLLRSGDFHALSSVLLFERLLPFLEHDARMGEDVDMYELARATGAEFISAYELGLGSGIDLVRKEKGEERRSYLKLGEAKLLNLKGKERAIKLLEDQALEMCKNAEKFLQRDGATAEESKSTHGNGSDTTTTFPVVFSQLRTGISTREGVTDPQMNMQTVASEVLDNIEAGREGVGIGLTYAMWELSLNPSIQHALRTELTNCPSPLKYAKNQHQPISASALRDLDSLPLLDAVVTETMRMHTISPGPQRRAVPAGGTVVDGFFIPAGVEISTSSYCLHRNEKVYPAADSWKPERWMGLPDAADGSEAEKGNAEHNPRRWYWAFGSGGKMCIGNHFALLGKLMSRIAWLSAVQWHAC